MISMKRIWPAASLGLLLWRSHTYADTQDARIQRVSRFYAVHYAGVFRLQLVEAVIEVESGWKAQAVSTHGACGLMQLMPATAQRFAAGNPFNIEQNIRAGVQYLVFLRRSSRATGCLSWRPMPPGKEGSFGAV